VVSLDTEVDKSRDWRVSSPATFRSVTSGIPRVLTPLFERYGVRPTYLLSPEVIEDEESADALAALGHTAELGTHLHHEFIEPGRTHQRATMQGRRADGVQSELSRAVELEKLANLTTLFSARFGRAPTAFRAGRFASSQHTLEILAGLGYLVDSSVTPGQRWRFSTTDADHRSAATAPTVVRTDCGPIVELPVTIAPGSRLAPLLRDAPAPFSLIGRTLLGARAGYIWLRPSFTTGAGMTRLVSRLLDEGPASVLVMMLHSMEICPGASPYAQDAAGVERIVDNMRQVFAWCDANDVEFSTMSHAAASIAP
jgi:hypothetical protein